MPIGRHVQNQSPRSKSVQSSQNDNRLNPLLFKSGKITKYVITKVNKKLECLRTMDVNCLSENVFPCFLLVIDQND